MERNGTLKLKVSEALGKDAGRALARLDPSDLEKLGAQIGDIVEIAGKRKTVAKAMPAYKELRGASRVQMDGVSRENAGVGLDQMVEVRRVAVKPAVSVVLAPTMITPSHRDLDYIGKLLDGLPVVANDRIRATLFGTRSADFKVVSTAPGGPVVIHSTTTLEIKSTPGAAHDAPPSRDGNAGRPVSYEDIGGLKREVARIREIIELPLRYPEVFERLGIDAPKGVLLHGPPGCGKTLIARAVVHETEANFFLINGPEIIHKFYGESEANLRKVFEEAARKAPSIIFLDEIDAIAPKREKVVGDVEKRVVAQLLALMDGLDRRRQVMVIAATNIPDALDPALRRPGRFDREIALPIPDACGRKDILEIHSRGMPLAQDVDLDHLAAVTHGFVGADLQALCREAAMSSLRRILPEIDFASAGRIPDDALMRLEVRGADFTAALREVEPSAIREVFVEVPDIRWKDVGGLDDIKRHLVESVEWPLKYPGLFAKAGIRPPKGILLWGPPGCGKTLLAKAAANESQVNFISIKGPALLSMYVGESERAVRDVFRKARQAASCILFLDEIDALVPSRRSDSSGDSGVSQRVVSQFLTEMDGMEGLDGVLVLAATNRPDLLDPALLRPGRFDVLLEIPPPDARSRSRIFEIGLAGKPMEKDSFSPDELAALSEGFSGAEIQAVCRRAALEAVREAVASAVELSVPGAAGEAGEKVPEAPHDWPVLIRRKYLQSALEEVRENRSTTGAR